MEYRQLGRSGLRVSTITLGTMGFGGSGWAAAVGKIDVQGAQRQIDMARDAGVNLFDTADVYSNGASEVILGQALGSNRQDVLLATKVRGPMGDGPNDAGLSRHHIIRAAEASLRRIGCDYIDLYQVHEWDGQTPLEETLAALDHLVSSGKVRYIGCSNYAAWQLMKALSISEREGLERFVSQQVYYSLQARDIEYEIVPLCVDQGLGILVWSPIAGGLLSGKYRRGVEAPPGSRHLGEWSEPPVHDQDKLYDTIEELVAIGADHGVSAAQVALAYIMAKPAVTSVIVGARTPEQLEDNLAAAELTLSADEMDRLDAVSAQPLLYPYWHQANTSSDRLSPADLTLLSRHVKS
jgi:aryl-alcohol dehydrogenase-like predicted oxidoreductase